MAIYLNWVNIELKKNQEKNLVSKQKTMKKFRGSFFLWNDKINFIAILIEINFNWNSSNSSTNFLIESFDFTMETFQHLKLWKAKHLKVSKHPKAINRWLMHEPPSTFSPNGLKMKGSRKVISNSILNPFFSSFLIFQVIETETRKFPLRFSYFFCYHRKVGWRLGLQIVTVLVSLSFFMGLLYRPASLYHPQRRAILHLKNSRKKVSVVVYQLKCFSSSNPMGNLIPLYYIVSCNILYWRINTRDE